MLLAICAVVLCIATYLVLSREEPEARPIRIRVRDESNRRNGGGRI